jgi:hypothetical protein
MGIILTIGQQVIVRGQSDDYPAAAGTFIGVDEYGHGVIENTIRTRHNGRVIGVDKFTTRHPLSSIEPRD